MYITPSTFCRGLISRFCAAEIKFYTEMREVVFTERNRTIYYSYAYHYRIKINEVVQVVKVF